MLPIRITNPSTLDINNIEEYLKAGKIIIVQFSGAVYTDEILSILDDLCLKFDENFGVRFYGFHFDCSTLLKIRNVKYLLIDYIPSADNIETIMQLDSLIRLSLGIYELKEVEILNSENLKQLRWLSLLETKTKALNLQHLSDFKKLEYLFVWGHNKNIESIGKLSNLTCLTLHAIKNVNISFINSLKKLKTLRFILGSRENINEIEINEIEKLEINWVRGFSDLSNISKFKNLKILELENNIRLRKVCFDKRLQHLEYLRIQNCKSLESLEKMENLPKLEKLWIQKTAINFETIISQNLPPTLKDFDFYPQNAKDYEDIRKRIIDKGFKKNS